MCQSQRSAQPSCRQFTKQSETKIELFFLRNCHVVIGLHTSWHLKSYSKTEASVFAPRLPALLGSECIHHALLKGPLVENVLE